MTSVQDTTDTDRILRAHSTVATAAALCASGFQVGDLSLPDDPAESEDNNWWTDPDIAASDDYPSMLLVGSLAAWKAANELGVPSIPSDSAKQQYNAVYDNDPDAQAEHYPDASAFLENNWPTISLTAKAFAQTGQLSSGAIANTFAMKK